jgi:hypothetical protein
MAKGRPTDDPKRATLNVRVATEDKKSLEALAAQRGETVSALAQQAIREYLRRTLPLPNPTIYNPLTDLLTPALTRAANHAQENHEHPATGTPTQPDANAVDIDGPR